MNLQGVQSHKALEGSISGSIGEGGVVRDAASEEVSRTRSRVRTVESRLRSLLKGMSGEATEQALPLCFPFSVL